MEIYSVIRKKNFEVRKMTIEERNSHWSYYRNEVSHLNISPDEMRKRMHHFDELIKHDAYIYQRKGYAPLIFSVLDKMKKWYPVHEQAKLF